MINARTLSPQSPVLFNELLHLFEACLATIGGPLDMASESIRDQFNYNHGGIFRYICGTKVNAHDMAKRIKQIRAARNSSADVTITLTVQEAYLAEVTTSDVETVLNQAASVLEMLHAGLTCRTTRKGRQCRHGQRSAK